MRRACPSQDELEDGELEDVGGPCGEELRGHGGIYHERAGDYSYAEALAWLRTVAQERRRGHRVGGAWAKELAHLVSVAGETWRGRVCDCGHSEDNKKEDALHGRFFGEKVWAGLRFDMPWSPD